MLRTFFKTCMPHRFLFPARRKFRDRPATQTHSMSDVSIIRLAAFVIGGMLLANLVLMTSAMLRTPVAPSQMPADVKPGAAAAEPAEPAQILATDARATPEAEEQARAPNAPLPAVARLSGACAEQAREKLIAGLTHYYMQRMLRPGAPTEEASDGAGLATLMAGPADPAVTTGQSCTG